MTKKPATVTCDECGFTTAQEFPGATLVHHEDTLHQWRIPTPPESDDQ